MFYDADHPNVSLLDWERFLKKPPSHLIAEVIDRSKTGLPEWFLPLARGAAIASDALLHKAGHRHGLPRPSDWVEIDRDVFQLTIDVGVFSPRRWLLVRQSFNPGLWMAERWTEQRQYDNADEILAHESAGTPIFTRSDQAAMRLAMYCHENGPPVGLRWISACPKDYLTGGKRRIDEVLTRRNAHQEDHLRGAA
jgi:hypothetical protein